LAKEDGGFAIVNGGGEKQELECNHSICGNTGGAGCQLEREVGILVSSVQMNKEK